MVARLEWLSGLRKEKGLSCEALSTRARREVCARSQVQWTVDVCRHTCISNLAELRRNDALVARECGTSEGVIYSRYHNLRAPEEVAKWTELRP